MLLLDENHYRSLSDSKKVLHLLQWLQNLPKVIKAAERVSSNPCSVHYLEHKLTVENFCQFPNDPGGIEVPTEGPGLPAPTAAPGEPGTSPEVLPGAGFRGPLRGRGDPQHARHHRQVLRHPPSQGRVGLHCNQ